MRNTPRTLLAQLCEQGGLTYRRFDERFSRTGTRLFGNSPHNPTCGETQFRRWTGGKLAGLPGPETCQILQAMWPGYTAEQLFGPPGTADDPQESAFNLEERVHMTAREAHDGAGMTAAASISDNSIDDLRDRMNTLARDYHRLPPARAYEDADDLRRELERQRERTQVPVQQQTLMILSGQVAALLAVCAFDLGYFPSARTLARTAALYGESSRFTPLQAYADGTLAYIAYHSGEPNEALAKARRALSHAGLGSTALRRLQAIAARAHAHLGDTAGARRFIDLSRDTGQELRDDLHDAVGGEFGFTAERLAMSNSTTALLIGDAARAAVEADRALTLIGERPPGERSTHVRAGAAADLAHARLLVDDVEAAADALTGLWDVPADQRNTGIVVRAARVARHLAGPRYHGSPLSADLRTRIEEFTRVSPPYRLGPPLPLVAIEP
ncbi:DNA-binding protein [Streptomyces sp. NPDC006798]|uniref:DNA-binding protein n=1 Tax=Streptomyces sp. NPDC006798 TaxID=3155462 RepID=UPI003410EC08